MRDADSDSEGERQFKRQAVRIRELGNVLVASHGDVRDDFDCWVWRCKLKGVCLGEKKMMLLFNNLIRCSGLSF